MPTLLQNPSTPLSRTAPGGLGISSQQVGVAGIQCKVAANKAERTAAFRLVYENYAAKQMIPENVYRLRVTHFHLQPKSAVFVAVQHGEVVATVSLILDGPAGLPMDSIQPEIGEAARLEGLRLAEVSCLAFRKLAFTEFLPIFVEMTRLMAQYGRANGIDQLIIGCVPRHAQFYCHFLGFEQVGDARPYSSVSNTIGVACRLNFNNVNRDRPDVYKQYFGVKIPDARLRLRPMSDGERDAFAHVVEISEHSVTINA